MATATYDRDRYHKLLHKADVLGFETRNVPRPCLEPLVLLSHTHAPPATHGSSSWQGSPKRSPVGRISPGGAGAGGGGSMGRTYDSRPCAEPSFQDRPMARVPNRTSRQLHAMGPAVIYNNNPYIDAAVESLLPMATRRTDGKLPRRGQKAAAVRRAKRALSQASTFQTEVPFPDALRVVCSQRDSRAALPALISTYIVQNGALSTSKLDQFTDLLSQQRPTVQLQAATQLMQAGLFFSAIRILYSDSGLLKAGLDELKQLLEPALSDEDWELAAAGWNWSELDRMLFVKHFKDLPVIAHYKTLRKNLLGSLQPGSSNPMRFEREMQLRMEGIDTRTIPQHLLEPLAPLLPYSSGYGRHNDTAIRLTLHRQGGAALARAEREMLLMVVVDLQTELDQEAAAGEDRTADFAAKAETWAQAQSQNKARDERRHQAALAAHAARREAAAARRAEQEQAGQDQPPAAKRAAPAERRAEQATAPARGASQAAAAIPEGEEGGEEGVQYYESSDNEGYAQGSSRAMQRQVHPPKGPFPKLQPRGRGKDSVMPSLCRRAPERVVEPQWGRAALVMQEPPQQTPLPQRMQYVVPPHAVPGKALPVPQAVHQPPARQASVQQPLPSPPPEPLQSSAAEILALPAEPSEATAAVEEPEAEPQADAPDESEAPADVQEEPEPPAAETAITDGEETQGAEECAAEASTASVVAAADENDDEQAARAAVAALVEGIVAAVIAAHDGAQAPAEDAALADDDAASGTEAPAAVESAPLSEAVPDPEPAVSEAAAEAEPSGLEAPADSEASAAPIEPQAEESEASKSEVEQPLDTASAEAEAADDAAETSGDGPADAGEAEVAAQEASDQVAEALPPPPSSRPSSRMTPRPGSRPRTADEQAGVDEEVLAMRRAMAEERAKSAEATERLKRQISAAKPLPPVETAQDKPSTPEVDVGALKSEIEKHMHHFAMEVRSLSLCIRKEAQSRAQSRGSMGGTGRLGASGRQPGMSNLGIGNDSQAAQEDTESDDDAVVDPGASILDEPPSQQEIEEYAGFLGIDKDADPELLHIAEWAITAPLPEGWTVHLDSEQREFFFNVASGNTTYEHPMDEHYREYYRKAKAEKEARAAAAAAVAAT